MRRRALACAVIALAACRRPLPRGDSASVHVLQLAPGVVDVHAETLLREGTEVRGAPQGTTLRLAPDFDGRAAFVVEGAGVRLHDFTLDGNRDVLEKRQGLPPSDLPFARYTRHNGILAEGAAGLTIERVAFRRMAGFAILVSASKDVTIDRVRVAESGSRNQAGRNNATGGILLEEGTTDFRVTHCELTDVRGNGIWTHSLFTSPRNARGLIALNRFANLARDAIQVGHATAVRVEDNSGSRIGYPADEVDIESQAVPVAIDTAGDVDASSYARNLFREVDGKCIDLDGFHDGEVIENQCINRPSAGLYPFGNVGILFNDSNPHTRSKNIRVIGNVLDGVKFTGIFAFGTGHTIANNRLLHINLAHCNEDAARYGCYEPPGEPEALASGIYLSKGVLWPEPSRGIRVVNNEITGFRMPARCIQFAPGVNPQWNVVRGNECRDATSARP